MPSSKSGLALLLLGALLACSPEQPEVAESRAARKPARQQRARAKPTRPPKAPPAAAAGEPDDPRAKVDPAADGWSSEVFHSASMKQLDTLVEWIEGRGAPGGGGPFVAPEELTVDRARPARLEPSSVDGNTTVLRPAGGELELVSGQEAIEAVASCLSSAFEEPTELHAKFKVLDLTVGDERVTNRVRFLAYGTDADGSTRQQNADWRITWVPGQGGEPPLIGRIQLERFEELHSRAGGLFEDCTLAVLGGNECFEPQVLENVERWLGSIQSGLLVAFQGHQGLALGDVNGDGLDDLYAPQAGGLPNLLFVQRPDGSAEDRSAAAGVDFLDNSQSALIVDLDGDGDQDLAVGLTPDLVLLANDGDGRFTVRRTVSTPDVYSMAATDYDGDGDLDLYLCSYVEPASAASLPTPYHDANNGRPNVLLRNDGGFAFADATEETGLDRNNRRFSFAASWEDYDDDGDPDLYVANDFGRNNLYRNDGGRFVDVAGEAGVEDISAGMGVTWGDYDGDGRMDAYVSNMFSSAGNRIAYQRRFKTEADSETRGHFQRHARGNTLFRNLGDGTFADVSEQAGVTMGRWAWGSKFVDLNNDGRLDIVVPNGFATSEDPGDL